jgi:glycopeptide antibiotics resistance protein
LDDPRTIHAAPVLLPVLAAYLVGVAVPAVRRRARLAPRRTTVLTTLVVYALGVAAITIFPITLWPAGHWAGEPWYTVVHPVPFQVDATSFVLNVVMMIPFGMLLPLLCRRTDSPPRIALYAAWTSLSIETVQFLLGLLLNSRRTVDVNDLIANTAGAVLGLALLRLAVPSAARRASMAARAPAEPVVTASGAGTRR